MKEKLCIVLTGGTICSVPNTHGKNRSDAKTTTIHLTEQYLNESDSPFRKAVEFDIKSISPDILSENMTVDAWNDILDLFRNDIVLDNYKGIIVLHGTDTLAYTSAFLSFALAGIPVPVCMVSAQLRLGEEDANGNWKCNDQTNGYANFRAAVELIMNGIAPNVYAVYRNEANEHNGKHEPGDFLVHYGSHLLQCPNHSNNFHSRDEMQIPDTTNAKLTGKSFESAACLYQSVGRIYGNVLLIQPYTNLNYAAIDLTETKAIVHGTYHSESVCIGRAKAASKTQGQDRDDYVLDDILDVDQPYSILHLLERCKTQQIPVFLAPCDIRIAGYSTTTNACKAGAIPVRSSAVTVEAMYAKAVLGCALETKPHALQDFLLHNSINDEFCR